MPADFHLDDEWHVVLPPPGADLLPAAAEDLARMAPGRLVVVAHAGRTVLQGPVEALHDALAATGAPVLTDPDRSVYVGLAGSLRALAAGDDDVDVAVDEAGAVLHRWSPGDGSSIVLNGWVRATAAGREPCVVIADDRDGLDAAYEADTSRDLVRILRYDDAVDDDPAWATVADEVLDVAFWTPEFCATVIRAAEATGAFTPQDDDPVPGHEVSLATISPALFDAVEQHVAAAVMPVVHQVWPYVDYHGLRDAFVIKYAPGVQTELRVHHDVAQLSGSVKLNDGYQGCALEFPRQSFANTGVGVGRMLVWPSLVTHPHRAAPLTAGVKYSLTLWFELPGGSRTADRHAMTRA